MTNTCSATSSTHKVIGILLGGGTLRRNKLPYNAKKRADKAYELLKNNTISTLILTGANNEAHSYYHYLLQKGIPPYKLIQETRAKDTIGNAAFSKDIILAKGLAKNIVIITSDFHIKRALIIFKHIFGDNYTITTKSSTSRVHHKIIYKFKEFLYKEVDEYLLLKVPQGDHHKAKLVAQKYISRYQ